MKMVGEIKEGATRKDIFCIYIVLFAREPEDQSVYDTHSRLSFDELLKAFLLCKEANQVARAILFDRNLRKYETLRSSLLDILSDWLDERFRQNKRLCNWSQALNSFYSLSDVREIVERGESDILSSMSQYCVTRKNLECGQKTKELAPLFSIILPLYNTPIGVLTKCVQSVLGQNSHRWELIVVDDGSPRKGLLEYLSRLSGDFRLKLIQAEHNGGIAKATNIGVSASSGDFIMFLDHDDELEENAVSIFGQHALDKPEADCFYSDQVRVDEAGNVLDSFCKPCWSPIYFTCVMYIGHLLAVRRVLCETVSLQSYYDGVQDFEFMLRISEITQKIEHIPAILYRWRAIRGSVAYDSDEKAGIDQKQAEASQAHLSRKGLSWCVEPAVYVKHRLVIKSGPSSATPRVSVVIPSRNQGSVVSRCIESIRRLTDYPDYEIIVVDNKTTDVVALQAFEKFDVKRIQYRDTRFNYSRANNLGVRAASGEYIILLNNDTEIIDPDWIRDQVIYFEDPSIGAVGPVLLYPNGSVQHAGVVLGARGTADHVMRGFAANSDGYAGSLVGSREVSAVTAACMMLRKRLYEDLGGLSEDFLTHYQDVDLCLKIRHRELSIVCAGNIRLVHHESLSRKDDGYDHGDRALLIDEWADQFSSRDPFYNKAFSLQKLDYSPEVHTKKHF